MKQTYYYRSISPTQIAGLADAILEKVFGFEQVPDMVTLTANAQGHFQFKAQFMYEDSIPFPQKRSTASKEKEKQKVKDIALAFFRTANEKVKANKQPKLENQDSVRQMFRDKEVDRGAFPSDFPDLFPIQYLEWQSTEPIFHAEYPKNIHYYEVRFRVELPVIAKQRNIIETPKTETVQNLETPVARLSSNAPTNHAPQTQKLLDTFLGNATQTPTVKATVQNEYIVLHINPDDKRYEIMGVFSYFVQIAGQEITDLLEMAGENVGLYFLQEGNLKVPYWTADGKVAASKIKGKVVENDAELLLEKPIGGLIDANNEYIIIEEVATRIEQSDKTIIESTKMIFSAQNPKKALNMNTLKALEAVAATDLGRKHIRKLQYDATKIYRISLHDEFCLVLDKKKLIQASSAYTMDKKSAKLKEKESRKIEVEKEKKLPVYDIHLFKGAYIYSDAEAKSEFDKEIKIFVINKTAGLPLYGHNDYTDIIGIWKPYSVSQLIEILKDYTVGEGGYPYGLKLATDKEKIKQYKEVGYLGEAFSLDIWITNEFYHETELHGFQGLGKSEGLIDNIHIDFIEQAHKFMKEAFPVEMKETEKHLKTKYKELYE